MKLLLRIPHLVTSTLSFSTLGVLMRKSTTLALLFSSSFTISVFADPLQFCLTQGGKLEEFVMLDKRRQTTEIKKVLCTFKIENEGYKAVAPETLSNPGQSFAVNFFRNPVAAKPSQGGGSPAAGYCTKTLKGLYANWRNLETSDEMGTCAFSDSSLISDWALVYGAQKLPKLNSKFGYK